MNVLMKKIQCIILSLLMALTIGQVNIVTVNADTSAVTLSGDTSVYVDDTVTLTATVDSPNLTTQASGITWESSDTTKATVTPVENNSYQATVTGIAAGEVTITATATGAVAAEGYTTSVTYAMTVNSKPVTYEAQIGDTKYETLYEAINSAVDNSTIILLNDVTLGTPSSAIVYTISQNITLNMNGKTITCNGKCGYSDVKLFTVESGKTFNVVGPGCVDITETNNYGYVFNNNGTVDINPGENNVLFVKAGYKVFNNLGTRNIIGGKFWQYSSASNLSSIVDQDNYEMITEVIDDKTFYVVKVLTVICSVDDTEYKTISAAMNASKVDGNITYPIVLMADATYTGDITENYTFSGEHILSVSGKIKNGTYDCEVSVSDGVISGGTFKTKPDDAKIASHYIATQNGEKWVVSLDENNAAASIGEVKYGTITDALAAANDGDTIIVLADSSENELKITNNKSVTIDLGSYDLTNASGYTINQYNAGTITIKGTVDSAIYGQIRLSGSTANVVFDKTFNGKVDASFSINSSGKLSIAGGYFKNSITSYLVDGYTTETTLDSYCHVIPLTDETATASVTTDSGTVLYSSLSKAAAAAKSGGTITLLNDTTAGDCFDYYNGTSGNIVFDLNGHIWNVGNDTSAMMLYGSSTFTIKDSAGTGSITGNHITDFNAYSGTTLIIDGANVSGAEINCAGVLVVNTGTIGSINLYISSDKCSSATINGGTFNSTIATKYGSSTALTISGGIFQNVTLNGGSLNMTDGTINGCLSTDYSSTASISDGYVASLIQKSSSTISISGGEFGVNPEAYLATGYKSTEVTTGRWQVTDNTDEIPDIVTYLTGDSTTTFTLNKDIDLSETYTYTIHSVGTKTVDLNGYTLTLKRDRFVVDGTLNLTNSDTTKQGSFVDPSTETIVYPNFKSGATITVNGTLNVTGDVKIYGITNAITVGEGGKLNLTGTTVEAKYAGAVITSGGDTKTDITIDKATISSASTSTNNQWSYTIRLNGKNINLKLTNSTVTGVQGAVSLSGEDTIAEIRNSDLSAHWTDDNPNNNDAFAALYVSQNAVADVYGTKMESPREHYAAYSGNGDITTIYGVIRIHEGCILSDEAWSQETNSIIAPDDENLTYVEASASQKANGYKYATGIAVASITTGTGDNAVTRYYATLQDAVTAAVSGNEIDLLANITLDDLTVDKNITLDLNGKTLTLPEGKTLTTSANVTIKDDAETKGGFINNGIVAVTTGTLDYSTLTFGTSGLIAGCSGSMTVASGATVKITTEVGTYYTNVPFYNADNKAASVAGGNPNFLCAKVGAYAIYGDTTYKCMAVRENANDNGDTWAEVEYVAQIGDIKYETLAAAIDAVPTDGTKTTITMIADVNLDVGVTIPYGKNVILELNGKTIGGVTTQSGNTQLIYNKGILTIQDNTDTHCNGTGTGLITNEAKSPDLSPIPSYASNTIFNRGTLTIKSGKIESTTSSGAATYAIDNQTQWYDSMSTVTLNIEGGCISRPSGVAIRMCIGSGAYNLDNENIKNVVNITGGVISSSRPIWVQLCGGNAPYGDLNITGGSFISSGTYAMSDSEYDGCTWDNVTYEITGGKFKGKVEATSITNFIKGGVFTNLIDQNEIIKEKYCIANDDDTYKYTIGDAVACIVETNNQLAKITDYTTAKASGDIYVDAWNFWSAKGYTDVNGNECPQYVLITDETVYDNANKDDAFSGKTSDENYFSQGKYLTYLYQYVDVTTNYYYDTLADAIVAVEDIEGKTATIKMIADETFADNATVTIPSDYTITLDLNGKTITGLNKKTSSWAMLTNNGTLTITDSSENAEGKITSSTEPETDGYAGHYTVLNKNVFILEKGTIEETSDKVGGGTNLKWAFRNEASANQTVTATIKGGTIIGEYNAVSNYVYDNTSNCTLNVEGGRIITTGRFSPVTMQIAGGTKPNLTLNISGGEFITQNIRNTNTDGNATVYWDDQSGSVTDISAMNISVTSGKFNTYNTAMLIQFDDFKISTLPTGYVSGGIFKIAIDQKEIATGYLETDNKDEETNTTYPYTVGIAAASIMIGDTTNYYATLEGAIAAVGDTATTITLHANVDENVTIPSGKTVTLDLAGFTVNGKTTSNTAAITNNGTLTVQDSSTDKTGTIKREDTGTYAYYVVDNQGTLTFEAGTITNGSGSTTAHAGASLIRNGEGSSYATLNIKGGTFTQDYFNVIKDGGYSEVNISGGTISCGQKYAILSYGKVTITGGNITGPLSFVGYKDNSEDISGQGTISGGTINGAITVRQYTGYHATTNPSLTITGGQFGSNTTFTVGEGTSDTAVTANNEYGTLSIKGGIYSNSPNSAYIADGMTIIANSDSKTKNKYAFGIGTKTAEVIIKEEDQTEGTSEVKVDVDTTIDYSVNVETNVVNIPSEIKKEIEEKTVVEGVELQPEKNIAIVGSSGKINGVQAVVNAAKEQAVEDKNTSFTKAVAASTTTNTIVTIKVNIEVSPVAITSSGNDKSIKFDLNPVATVTIKNGDSAEVTQQVEVTNEMIDTDKPITVELYTGFEPKMLIHRGDDGSIIDIYYPDTKENSDANKNTFTYDDTTGVCTAIVHHFSSMEAVEEQEAIVIVAEIGTAQYESLATAIAAVSDGETITLLADNTETITVNEAKAFTIDPNNYSFTGSIKAGTGLKRKDNETGNTYTFTEITYTVIVQSRINGTDKTVANVSGGGDISGVTGTTLSAPNQAGYTFLGWYTGYSSTSIGTNVTTSHTYTIIPKEDNVTYTAVYKAKTGETFSLTVDGSEFTITGRKATQRGYQTYKFNVSDEITVTYTDSNYKFLYWANGSDNVVSTQKQYTFTLGSEVNLHAVYAVSKENQALVVFESAYDQILSAQTYTSDDDDVIDFPTTPSKMGYKFKKWIIDGTQTSDYEGTEATDSNIKNAMALSSTIIVVPIYSHDNKKYQINISYKYPDANEEGGYGYIIKDSITDIATGNARTVTAQDSIYNGNSFCYWEDSEGNILSYSKEYMVISTQDVNLIAVYGVTFTQTATCVITSVTNSKNGESYYRLTFSEYYTIPSDCEFVRTGFVETTDSSAATESNMIIGAANINTIQSSLTNSYGNFTINFSKLTNPDLIIYMRGYVQYKKGDTVYTVYSSIAGYSYNEVEQSKPVENDD